MKRNGSTKHLRILSILIIAASLSGCLLLSEQRHRPVIGNEQAIAILDVSSVIQHQWEELQIKGSTEYRVVSSEGKPVIWATGRNSASGLIRFIDFDADQCPDIQWSWRVDQLQPDANLHLRSADDVAASIYLLFGDPGLLSDPELVPTLRYVWSNDKVEVNDVVNNPYLPKYVHSVVVRTGEAHLGQWITETRNIVDDYKLAFGSKPPGNIQAVVLFTDNDQTEQSVKAGYAWIKVSCQ